jgi:hypothetical protein
MIITKEINFQLAQQFHLGHLVWDAEVPDEVKMVLQRAVEGPIVWHLNSSDLIGAALYGIAMNRGGDVAMMRLASSDKFFIWDFYPNDKPIRVLCLAEAVQDFAAAVSLAFRDAAPDWHLSLPETVEEIRENCPVWKATR